MDDVPELVERLFRQRSGELTAVLTRTLGARHFELAEEAVQEALGKPWLLSAACYACNVMVGEQRSSTGLGLFQEGTGMRYECRGAFAF